MYFRSEKFRWVLDKLMGKLDEKIYRRLNPTSSPDTYTGHIFRTQSFHSLLLLNTIWHQQSSDIWRHVLTNKLKAPVVDICLLYLFDLKLLNC